MQTNSFKTIPLTIGLLDLVNQIINYGNESNILKLATNESYLFNNKTMEFMDMKLRAEMVSKQFKKILKKLKLNNDFKYHSL